MTRATVHFDGASSGNPGKAGAGAIVEIGGRQERLSKSLGRATNNEAEYEALILGLRFAQAQGASEVAVRGDSQLVIRQLKGRYKVRAENLQPLYQQARELLDGFDEVDLAWLAREGNEAADDAARAAIP